MKRTNKKAQPAPTDLGFSLNFTINSSVLTNKLGGSHGQAN
jgi:hypothetical protein